jgi:hypothetical protein
MLPFGAVRGTPTVYELDNGLGWESDALYVTRDVV